MFLLNSKTEYKNIMKSGFAFLRKPKSHNPVHLETYLNHTQPSTFETYLNLNDGDRS